MTRRECEQAIVEKLREIWDIYQEYYPGGEGLSIHATANTAWLFNGDSLDGGAKPLDYFERVEEVEEDAIDEW
jgi:hypothetical protein